MNKIQLQKQLIQKTKYSEWYLNIIENAQNRFKNNKLIYEKHHILPKSIFEEFSDLILHQWNSALLTPKEHFIAHVCIWKHYKMIGMKSEELKMGRALNIMKRMGKYSAKSYEQFKIDFIPWNKDKKGVQKAWNKGINTSKKTKNKMSLAQAGDLNHMFGKQHSNKTIQLLSVPKGKQKLVICPKCGQEGGISNMKRWHFDNCNNLY